MIPGLLEGIKVPKKLAQQLHRSVGDWLCACMPKQHYILPWSVSSMVKEVEKTKAKIIGRTKAKSKQQKAKTVAKDSSKSKNCRNMSMFFSFIIKKNKSLSILIFSGMSGCSSFVWLVPSTRASGLGELARCIWGFCTVGTIQSGFMGGFWRESFFLL